MNYDKLEILRTLIGDQPLSHYNVENGKEALKKQVDYWYDVLKDEDKPVYESSTSSGPQLLNEHTYGLKGDPQ